MDGKYLPSNIGPLKVLGDGKVFIKINDLLNTFEKVELVAYSIVGNDSRIVTINCLFEEEGNYGPILSYRNFDFYRRSGKVQDNLKLTADFGVGLGYFDIQNFMNLRDFYLEHSKASKTKIS